MIAKTSDTITTAEQLLAMPHGDNRYQLIKGVLCMMSPAGSEHGRIAGRIFTRLAVHVETLGLGITYAAETGFRIAVSPDTVRAPDAAYVSHHRLASIEPTRGYLPLAPDLVIEVISPSDSYSEVEAKVTDWLEAGSRIVLVADPENRLLKAYRSASDICTFRSGQIFESGEVCGNFTLAVDDAFKFES